MSVQATNVRTKSVYNPAEPTDGRRVLTTQYWPRGIPKTAVDEYIRKLAPSRELLHAFKRGQIDWDAFRSRYLQEMESPEAQAQVCRLAEAARTEAITLMCACKDESECHRSLLRTWVLRCLVPA